MKITLLSDDSIRLEPEPGPMTIVAVSPEQSFSPFHMLAGGLAYCTFSVLYTWAGHAGLNAQDLSLEVSWRFARDPLRIERYDMHFNWPSLPEVRLDAARRVAKTCTIHATFERPPVIAIDVARDDQLDATAPPHPASA